jgi:hypothetical protein
MTLPVLKECCSSAEVGRELVAELVREVEFAALGLNPMAKPDDLTEVGDIDVVFGIDALAARCSSPRPA